MLRPTIVTAFARSPQLIIPHLSSVFRENNLKNTDFKQIKAPSAGDFSFFSAYNRHSTEINR
jgi:hypothetical protein